MQTKICDLIGELPEGKMLSFTITLNDDLNSTKSRYKDLKNGQRPPLFRPGGKNPFVADPSPPQPAPQRREQQSRPKRENRRQPKPKKEFVDFEKLEPKEEPKKEV